MYLNIKSPFATKYAFICFRKPITNQVQPNTGAAWPYGQQQIRGQMQNPRNDVNYLN